MQLASWYYMPPGKVRIRFTPVLSVEWQGVLYRKCNSKMPLVFAHMALTMTLGA